MTLPHPLSWFPVKYEGVLLVTLVIATALATAGILNADGNLRTEVTPLGITSFELIGNLPDAQRALVAWGEMGRAYAAFSFGLDYLYIVAYCLLSILISRSVGRSTEARFPLVSGLSVWVGWLFVGVGLLDALENTVLMLVVFGSGNALWPKLGFVFASLKFSMAGMGALYLLIGSGLGFLNRSPR